MVPAGLTVILKVAAALASAASSAVTVTVDTPAVVGVPVTSPVAPLMVRPAGRPVADHSYGAFPPVALTVNGAMASLAVKLLSATGATRGALGSMTTEEFWGSGAPIVKSAELLSVSALAEFRLADVELLRAAVAVPSRRAAVPYPTRSRTVDPLRSSTEPLVPLIAN